jgi:hypothetical protein
MENLLNRAEVFGPKVRRKRTNEAAQAQQEPHDFRI